MPDPNSKEFVTIVVSVALGTGVLVAVIFFAATAVVQLINRNLELFLKRNEGLLEANRHWHEKNNMLLEMLKVRLDELKAIVTRPPGGPR